ENPLAGGLFFQAAGNYAGTDQGMDFASGRIAAAFERGKRAGLDEGRHAAVLGRAWKRGKSFERDDSFYSSGVAGEAAAAEERSCLCSGVRAGFQRGVPAAPMELSVIAYLALLVVEAALRIVELKISKSHQAQMLSRGAAKVEEPRFRWMVVLHT